MEEGKGRTARDAADETAGSALRWFADDGLRRHWAADADEQPDWSATLVGDDGLGWRRAVHPADLEWYADAQASVAGTDQRLTIDVRIRTPDGRERYLREELRGRTDGASSLEGTALDVTDIMARLELERDRMLDMHVFDQLARRFARDTSIETLVASLASHANQLLGTMNVAVLLASDDRRDLLVYQGPNPASGTKALRIVAFTGDTPAGLAAVTGEAAFYRGPEDIAANFPKLHLRIGDDRILSAAALPLDGGDEPMGAIWYRWPDATGFDDHLVNLLHRTTNGFGAAVLRLQAEEQQQARLEELLLTNRELESLSAVAAHDLKAPLRRVHSFMQLLEAELGPEAMNDDARRYAAIIRDQISDMNGLIEDMLHYSAASRPDIGHDPVDLAHVVNDALITLEPAISAADAIVTVGVLPTVRGDAALLGQLFSNLIENAIKYRHPDRTPVITIDAEPHSDDERHPEWRVRITDNGSGIAPELHEKVFQIFERGDVAGTDGTGIGLAIVKRITERHGGTVRLESEPGAGSTFHLVLPGIAAIQTV